MAKVSELAMHQATAMSLFREKVEKVFVLCTNSVGKSVGRWKEEN